MSRDAIARGQRSKRSPGRVFAIRVLGSAAILALLLVFVPFRDLVAALRQVPPLVWVGALGAYLLLHLIGVCKWLLVINAAGAELSFLSGVRCYYYGLFGNLFLPSIIGGDVVRAGLAMSLARSRSGLVLGSLAERLLDTIGLAAVAGIGALLLPTALDPRSRLIFLGMGGLFLVAGAGAFAILLLTPVIRRLPIRRRRALVKIRQAYRALRERPARLIGALLLSMLLQSLLVLLNARLGDVIGIDISFVVWLFVWPLAKIAAILPVTQGGIGVREGALVLLFQPFGVSSSAAMATGLVFTAVVMCGGLVGGVIAFVLARVSNDHRQDINL
ncbi:MAG: lysylphosphatidylglycerol synthase transmembrane domain-containing protein [Gemmatimonadota bacterium]